LAGVKQRSASLLKLGAGVHGEVRFPGARWVVDVSVIAWNTVC
jgi:hypothetical protein